MERLWAPWRMKYIRSRKPDECIFCQKLAETDDAANHVVWRGSSSFVLLNTYPYNNGHLMIAPHAHIAELEDLAPAVTADMMSLAQDAVVLLKEEFNAQGVNLGFNLGEAAGAGIKDHLHMHLVPRWSGDTNYMPVIADVSVIPQSLEEAQARLSAAFARLRAMDPE